MQYGEEAEKRLGAYRSGKLQGIYGGNLQGRKWLFFQNMPSKNSDDAKAGLLGLREMNCNKVGAPESPEHLNFPFLKTDKIKSH
jgi:hypothetical protein